MESLPPPHNDNEKLNRDLLSLSGTELKVLYLLSDLKTSRQISEELFVSPYTVNNHCARIRQKLELKGQKSLLKFALTAKGKLTKTYNNVIIRID